MFIMALCPHASKENCPNHSPISHPTCTMTRFPPPIADLTRPAGSIQRLVSD